PWTVIDAQFIALPISFILAIVVSLFSENYRMNTSKNAGNTFESRDQNGGFPTFTRRMHLIR
ncbi:MAG: hypothetical protein HWN71_11355, partial [Desulfobacterales bacterium]|nr:hypothetical protein [Desulfobacterales bacterium]